MTTSKARTTDPSKVITRPTPTTALERAERIADDREGMLEDHEWEMRLRARFKDAGERDVIGMWKRQENEHGRPLSKFELAALVERWCELFGFMPPFDGEATSSSSMPGPSDDDMLTIVDVARMTSLSPSTINRYYRAKPPRLPPPVKLSPRRKGWLARDIKEWIAERTALGV